jgi:hypothetical protein
MTLQERLDGLGLKVRVGRLVVKTIRFLKRRPLLC